MAFRGSAAHAPTHPEAPLHRPSGQAIVSLDGREIYLGAHGTQASRAEYDRLIGESLTHGCRHATALDRAPELTVNELILQCWKFAETYYSRDGIISPEMDNIGDALQHIRPLFGRSSVAEIGPLSFQASWGGRR